MPFPHDLAWNTWEKAEEIKLSEERQFINIFLHEVEY